MDRKSMEVRPLGRSMMVRRVVLRDIGQAMRIIGLLGSFCQFMEVGRDKEGCGC
jgi:hypothetical protein